MTLCRSPFAAQAFACWNWKCALLSALARTVVYLAALAHAGARQGLSIAIVEMVYVTLTAGVYAGLQQQALGLRSRALGNLLIVVGVPGLSQVLDWLVHRLAGAAAPPRATLAVCGFAAISALFHLFVMRRGTFLTGGRGSSLVNDFRRLPHLVLSFTLQPVVFLGALAWRQASAAPSESSH